MAETPNPPATIVVVTNDGMGHAEQALRHKLFRTWLTLLLENGVLPDAICFYTEGVRMVVEGSPVLDLLRKLEARKVHLISCGTCLNHFGLMDRVAVGVVGGMPDILAAQLQSRKVITL